MKKHKYKVTFYTFEDIMFIRMCTRTYISVLKFAIKTAIKRHAVFSIRKIK